MARVEEKNGSLKLTVPTNPGLSGELKHWYYDTFLCKWDDRYLDKSLVTFIINVNGQVEELKFKVREDFVDPLEYTFKK